MPAVGAVAMNTRVSIGTRPVRGGEASARRICTMRIQCTHRGRAGTAAGTTALKTGRATALKSGMAMFRGRKQSRAGLVLRAGVDGDDAAPSLDDIDARLELIKKAGSSSRRKKTTAVGTEERSEPLTVLDYADEKVFFDGPPSRGDLAVNILLGATLLWLPLTFASIGRAVWLRYRITDKRVSIISTSPLENSRTDIPYTRVQSVVAIGRGVGAWGDMVLNLDKGDKLEMRSLENWQEAKTYIEERMEAAKKEQARAGSTSKNTVMAATMQGFGEQPDVEDEA